MLLYRKEMKNMQHTILLCVIARVFCQNLSTSPVDITTITKKISGDANSTASSSSNSTASLDGLRSYLEGTGYDRTTRPGETSGESTRVKLDFLIVRLSSFDAMQMEYEATMYFRQTWTDERLANRYRRGIVTLSHGAFSRVWVPDTFFSNEKEARLHSVTVPNRLITLDPNGTIVYSQKISAAFGCEFKLHRFPHDNQTCRITIESYGFTEKDIKYEWKDVADPVQRQENLLMPEFRLVGYSIGDCSKKYLTGNFSCKYAELYLSRDIGYYVTRVYIPSMLLVGLAWISFWIDYHAVPARISLGLITVLTMTAQSSSARLPEVSYVKAIDVWMITCLLFVFSGLLEYCVVNVLARIESNEKKSKKSPGSSVQMAKDSAKPSSMGPSDNRIQSQPKIGRNCTRPSTNHSMIDRVNSNIQNQTIVEPTGKKPQLGLAVNVREASAVASPISHVMRVEKLSRILFPLMFIAFNICYWSFYYSQTY